MRIKQSKRKRMLKAFALKSFIVLCAFGLLIGVAVWAYCLWLVL